MPKDGAPDAKEDLREGRPVGQGNYVVQDGEGLAAIAARHGHFWETCWNDPANAELRRVRRDPEVLLPGDRLTIPPLRLKQVQVPTTATHRFRRRGVPSLLRLRLLYAGEPRAGVAFTLEVDGRPLPGGVADADGWIKAWIPPGSRRAKLRIEDKEEYEMMIGHLYPSDDVRGVRQRLENLGYLAADASSDVALRAAVFQFQASSGLSGSGEIDDPTRAALVKAHGS